MDSKNYTNSIYKVLAMYILLLILQIVVVYSIGKSNDSSLKLYFPTFKQWIMIISIFILMNYIIGTFLIAPAVRNLITGSLN